ncbi:MAG TPA: hypothetical protein VFB38_13925 [Chthonomonadaceae bacterium]|nr:hypothetical protein [Chthonomonadaceae bacterium]
MTPNYVLYAGTVGQGVWRSDDGGETFARACAGMFMEAEVRALAVHPQNPGTLYAGTDAGLYRTQDGGERWQRLEAPFDPGQGWQAGTVIWSLLIPPQKPGTLLVGACPSAIYRSEDEGATWEKLNVELVPECGPIRYSRVTCLLADPTDADTLWAGVEIDGVRRSADGGQTWQRCDQGLSSLDIHALAVVPGSPKTLLAATNNDLNRSVDNGATWQPQNVKATFPWAYCRGIAQKADDPRTLFLGNGNGPPGTAGAIQISHDGGLTWQQAALPVPPNSTIWTFATNPAAPDLIFAASVSGYLYRSEDGGATWEKCRHEFGEVRALALVIL